MDDAGGRSECKVGVMASVAEIAVRVSFGEIQDSREYLGLHIQSRQVHFNIGNGRKRSSNTMWEAPAIDCRWATCIRKGEKHGLHAGTIAALCRRIDANLPEWA